MSTPALDPLVNTPGHHPSPDKLVNIPRLVTAFYANHPDPEVPAQRVSFGTSGHRGSAFNTSFNYAHILAITQAIVEYRANQDTTGPLFLAQDTHALSEPAFTTALEVLAANGVEVFIDQDLGFTPTPVLSHAILTYNAANAGKPLADGIVITPSHNPPEDGGFKYNPTNGGPADTTATKWIQDRANELIAAKLQGIKRSPRQLLIATTSSPPTSTTSPTSSTSACSPAPPSSSPSTLSAAPVSTTGRASPSNTNSRLPSSTLTSIPPSAS
jgi:phosphoglucomutase